VFFYAQIKQKTIHFTKNNMTIIIELIFIILFTIISLYL